jgi:hypothetical protein
MEKVEEREGGDLGARYGEHDSDSPVLVSVRDGVKSEKGKVESHQYCLVD